MPPDIMFLQIQINANVTSVSICIKGFNTCLQTCCDVSKKKCIVGLRTINLNLPNYDTFPLIIHTTDSAYRDRE